jgi:hypothetical protein
MVPFPILFSDFLASNTFVPAMGYGMKMVAG